MPHHFADLQEMLLELFGDSSRHVKRLSPFELALLISHKRALSAIACGAHAWGAVFEDDAYLHESAPPSHAAYLIKRAFATARAHTVVYLGSCDPRCEVGNAETTVGDLPLGLLRGGICRAYCTHAYALSRSHASSFFADVFNCHDGPDRCGRECQRRPCFMDWAMTRHFLTDQNVGMRTTRHDVKAWVLAGGLRSPWASDHHGLFIQNRSAALGNNVSGTSLHGTYEWPSAQDNQHSGPPREG